jgi:hypothetical protein
MGVQIPLTGQEGHLLGITIHWDGPEGGPTLHVVEEGGPVRQHERTVSLKGLLGLLDLEDPVRRLILRRHQRAISDGRQTAEAHRGAITRLTGAGDGNPITVDQHMEALRAVRVRTNLMVRQLGEARTLG